VSRRIQTGVAPRPAASVVADLDEVTLTEFEPETQVKDLSQPLLLGGESRFVSYAASSTAHAESDGYLDRLLKYIPTEIIALYLGATNIVPSTDSSYWTALWIIAALTALCTPIYMYFATREEGQPTLWSQIVISSIAFPIWVFAIGGPFRHFSWYNEKHWIGAIAISFSTFAMGIHKPKQAPAQQP
jgi:hypothetical protein